MMRKYKSLFLVLIILILSSCQLSNSNGALTLEDILKEFDKQGIEYKNTTVTKDNIFSGKYNSVKPNVYEVNGKNVMIYIYDSPKEREEGLEDFRKKTEQSNLVSFKFYDIKNVLICYVYEDEIINLEIDGKIQEVKKNLEK